MKYGPEQSGRLIRGGQALGVGLTAVSSLIYLDGRAGKRRWPSTNTLLVGVPSPEVEELTLAFPGLGSSGGAEHAQHIKRIVPGPSAHFEYSSDHISINGLAAQVRQEAPNITRINVSGHSMGGPLGLETARRAWGSEAKFGHIVLYCSPFERQDGRGSRASKILKAVRWAPGPGHKFTFQTARLLLEGRSLRESLEQGRLDANTGCSPRVWLSMLGILEGMKLQKHTAEYADMVDEQTKVWYCMPEDSTMDTSVYTEQASEKYGEFFESIGAPFTIWRIPNIGHAEVIPTVDYLEQYVGDSTESLVA